jgi:hypothetical protein
MSPLRLNGSTSGYSEIDAPAIAGDQTFTLPGTGGTLDRLNRAGNILQVVSATTSTEASTTGTSYIDTNLSCSITPSSASSKVFIIISQQLSTSSDNVLAYQLVRGSTSILEYTHGVISQVASNIGTYASVNYLDSPASTSSLTYKTQIKSRDSGETVVANRGTTNAVITLMEVAA